VHGPLDHHLLATYRAHKRLAKALRMARSFTADGDMRAGRTLDLALAELPRSAARTLVPAGEAV
jgi:hypothetical protein